MNDKLRNILDMTNDIHLPILLDESEMAENRLVKKPVLKSRLLDDMETLDNWEAVTPYAQLELSSDRFVSGSHSLKFTHPTNLKGWGDADSHMYNPGRIYACPSAFRRFEREDWREYNRLSAWVYPIAPGMKSITLRMQLHNDGVNKVPDQYLRDGAHNMSLKGNCWNHVVLEIPYLDRDCVTGVSFDYDMVGHEPDAVDHVTWYLDQLELQEVKCDVYEGWIPADDRISYSNSGYQTGSVKIAVASGITSPHFKVIETTTGRVVLQKEIETTESKFGQLQVLNFSEIMEQGEYILIAGEHMTRTFSISDDVWESSVWKMLNFFLVLRCGYDVLGKHRACHSDMLLQHDGKSIVVNGGWHDAGDLAQGLNNTSEATAALLSLAMSLNGRNNRLYKRVLEEAKWGLDYVLKTRFGDGFRAVYSSCSIWTDGVIGTDDDVVSEPPVRSAYANFNAAYAESLGVKLFAEIDPDYARYCLKIAKEDFAFGMEILAEIENERKFDGLRPQFKIGDQMDVQVFSCGVLAATELYKLTQEESYRETAFRYGDVVLACQEQELTDWDIPMVGFYYQDRERDLIWHHNHMSYAYIPDLAMRALCESFPTAENYMQWYAAIVLSGEYYKAMAKFTFPYGIIPAGVFHENEAQELGQKVFCNHPASGEFDCLNPYKEMVQKGFPLGKGYYLRVYPVWFSFRGNYNVMLSEGKSMSSAALIRNNYDLYATAQQQFEWIVGKNPTCQSTLYGEGYDYIQLYAVQPGQTVGAISVGMESHRDTDAPFWPQVNNATYKEVWVCSATKWIWGMTDSFLPGRVSGYAKVEGNTSIRFIHVATQREVSVLPHPRTGFFEITLAAGNYQMIYGEKQRNLTVISGKEYQLDGDIYALQVTAKTTDGRVTITITAQGEHDLPIEVFVDNLTGGIIKTTIPMISGSGEVVILGDLVNPKKPYCGIVIPNGNRTDQLEFVDERIR